MYQTNSLESAHSSYEYLDDNMYVVEKILKKRTIFKHGKEKIMYFVRWEGYPEIQDHTWEPEEHLRSVPALVEEFEKKLQEKKKRQSYQQSKKNEEVRKQTSKLQSKNNSSQFRKPQNQSNSTEVKTQKRTIRRVYSSEEQSEGYEQLNRRHQNAGKEPSKGATAKEINKDARNFTKPEPKAAFRKEIVSDKEKGGGQMQQKHKNEGKEYGQIVNHIYDEGLLFYEVQVLSADQKVKQIVQISSHVASAQCQKSTLQYLQKLLVKLEETNRLK